MRPITTTTDMPLTTLLPCPAEPLACLPGGERPIPYCPCIDPRYQKFQNKLQKTPPATETPNPGDVFIFADLHRKPSAKVYSRYP